LHNFNELANTISVGIYVIIKGEIGMTGIDPKVDFIFKIIFGNEDNTDILLSFLNSILKLEKQNRLDKIEVLNPFIKRELLEDKTSILDIKAKTIIGELINIEIQLSNKYNMDKRSLYYWSKLYSGQLSVGEDYKQLKKTITINIINFNYLDGKDFHKVFHLKEESTGKILNDQLEIHFVELLKVPEATKEERDPLQMWLQFLKYENKEVLEEYAMADPAIKKAINVLDLLNRDVDTKELYEIREKALKDETSMINGAKLEGKIEGKLEDAAKMLEKGLSVEDIMEITGLKIEEIKKVM